MKAAIFTEVGKPLSIRDVQIGELRYGHVWLRMKTAGICGRQLQEMDGHITAPAPRIIGHEGFGKVIGIGEGVKHVKVGDHCVVHWRIGAGLESDFPTYRMNGSTFTSGKATAFAEEVVVSENRVTPIPEDAHHGFAALLGCGLSTALGTIEQEANVQMGERVLIIGCGGLGVNLIKAAKMRHAWVTVTDCISTKGGIARLVGADSFTINFENLKPIYDVVIDTSGSNLAISRGMALLAPSGRMVMVGHPAPDKDVLMTNADHMFEGDGKSIKATQGGGFRPDKDIPRYYNLWKNGNLDIRNIVSETVYLNDINKGIELVRNGEAGRILVTM